MKASVSSEDVARVSEDLSQCRSRLDTGIEENRRNRQMIEDLNHQLARYRQKAAHDAEMSATSSVVGYGGPSSADVRLLAIDTTSPTRYARNEKSRHKSLGRIDRFRSNSPREFRFHNPLHRSSPRLNTTVVNVNDYTTYRGAPESNGIVNTSSDDDDIEELYGKLKNELFKNNTLEEVNEMLREENDAALAANDSLRVDLAELTKRLATLQQQQNDDSMRFRSENTRYRNQVETQHRKLLSLWKEFTAVKRQLNELRTTAANDMDRQMTEFTRCATLMQRAIRHAEEKNQAVQDEMRKEKDDILDETLRQLNTASENFMKAEEKANDRAREVRRAEDEVRKSKEKIEELQEAIKKISGLLQEKGRTRSQSPISSRSENAMDVARKMRKLLTSKNGEIREKEDAVRRVEGERDRLKKDLEREEKRRKEERNSDGKRNNLVVQRETQIKRLENDLRKANEKIRILDEQRESQEKLVMSVQNSLADAHRLHKTFIEELMTRHREELTNRQEMYAEDMAHKIDDEKSKTEKERVEKDRLRKDCDEMRETQRNLKAELAAMTTSLEDKALKIELLEDETRSQKKRLAEEREHVDARELDMQEMREKIVEMQEKEVELRRELVEAQNTSSVTQEDAKQNQEESMRLKNEIVELQEKIETMQNDFEVQSEEIVHLKKTIIEKETQVQTFNTNLHQLNANVDEANTESGVLKTELHRLREQIEDRQKHNLQLEALLEEAKRNNENLHDDVASWQSKADDFGSQLEELQRKAKSKEQEENELRSLLEDLRVNFDRLTNETKQKSITIDSLNDEIDTLKEDLKRRDNYQKEEIERMQELEKTREEQMKAEYEAQLKTVGKEKADLDKVIREAEGRLDHLTKIHEELMQEELRLKMENDELKEELDETRKKAKKDVEKANSQSDADREDWHSERNKLEASKNDEIGELNEKISRLEDDIRAANDREDGFRRDADNLKVEMERNNERVVAIEKKMEENEEEKKLLEKSIAEEKARLVEERENALLTAIKQETHVDQQTRKIEKLEAELDKLNTAIADRESSINALEQNTIELVKKIDDLKKDEENAKDEIAVLSKQNTELRNNKEINIQKLGEEKKRNEELSDQIRDLNKQLHSLRMKNVNSDEKHSENTQQIATMNNKIRQLEMQIVDKTAKLDISNDLVKKMEHDSQSMAKELKEDKIKLAEFEKQSKRYEEDNRQLSADLQATKAAFEMKRETSKSAINDILAQYRKADERANETILENQKLRGETQALTMKLDRLEKSRKDLETRARESESKAADAFAKLVHLQQSAVDSLTMQGTPQKGRYVEIPRSISTQALNDTHSSSGHGDSLVIPRPPSQVRFADSIQDVSLDVSSSVGVTLRFLKERIEQLEIDKAELAATLDHQRSEMREKTEKLKDSIAELEKTKRSMGDLRNEKNTLESRINSQRQVYLSNEESTRSKDHELRSYKARLTSFELHLREKEAKVGQLKAELSALQEQLREEAATKNRMASNAAAKEERWRENEEEFDRILRERDELANKFRRLTAEHENLVRRLEQLDNEREHLIREITDERRANDRLRENIDELKSSEKQWRTQITTVKRTVEEEQRRVVDQRRMEQAYSELAARNEALNAECERLRRETKDYVGKMNQLNIKTVEAERRNDEMASNLATLTQHIGGLKKFEIEWKQLEKEMREELKVLRKDKLSLTSEAEDWKRRTLRNETEKKEIEAIRVRLEREIAALKKHVDALEEEKNRTEQAVRETMGERKAIDKSLAAMERENTQLYRNCSQLQNQVSQLERDAGNRSVARLAKEHAQLEARIATLIDEKRQLQAIIEQKDASHAHKKKLMESQMSLLRDQIDAERKRRDNARRADGSVGRRAVQHTSAFRKTYERSVSCERTVFEQTSYARFFPLTPPRDSSPLSPLSPSDTFTSGTLIM